MVQAISAGADDFVSKPIRPGELLARLQAGQRILELQRQLSFLATRDQLTGLLSRRTFFEILEQQFQHAIRENRQLACVMVDIDSFKAVNDEYGHLVGDEVLAAVAGVLKQCRRASDSICRYGGEEFCVLLLDCDLPALCNGANAAAPPWPIRPASVPRGRSALRPASAYRPDRLEPESGQQLLNMADQALLQAKRSGRNRVVAFQKGQI